MDVVGFLLTVTPITLSPGASFTLAMNNAINLGSRGVMRVIAGTALGIYTHALLAGLGIAALLTRYPSLMRALTLLGTGYLVYIALRLILSARRAEGVSSVRGPTIGIRVAYIANVLNIKAVLLYVTVVPLFAGVAVGPPSFAQSLNNYLLLGTLHIALHTVWLLFASQLLMRSAGAFNPQRLKRAINFGGGVLLLGLTLWPLLAG